MHSRFRPLLVPLVLALLVGCRTDPEPRGVGVEPLRFHNWWNYYERALLRMEARNYGEAAEDLRRCLGLIPSPRFGMPVEKWRIRTYGMHLLDDYFPHRELAICLHLQGRDAEAQPLLEKSLSLEPSDRARHFLGLVRTRLLVGPRRPAPGLRFPAGTERVVNTTEVEVEAEAFGPGGLAQLRIGGEPVPVESDAEPARGARTLSLPPGEQAVLVEATDRAGGRTSSVVRILVDLQAPSASFRAARRDPAGHWAVTCAVRDDHALRRAEWRGRVVYEARGENESEALFDLEVPAAGEEELVVTDRAGNMLRMRPRTALAAAGWGERYADTAAADGGPALRVPAEGLELSLGCASSVLVHASTFFLDGEIACAAGLRTLVVNGRPWAVPSEAGDRRVHFAGFLPLAEGDNPCEILATDQQGRVLRREIRVRRAQPEVFQPKYRLAAVLPPILRDDLFPSAQASLLQALVRPAAAAPARFRTLARGQDFLRVLGELHLSLSDLCADRARIDWGKLDGGDLFFCGQLFPHHLGHTLRVHAFDGAEADGGWLGADDVYLPSGADDLDLRFRGLASKLERRFPLCGGSLSAVSPAATARLPRTDLRPGTRFLVVRPGPDGTLGGGRVVHWREEPLEWRLRAISGDSSNGRLEPPSGKTLALPGDLIYTR